MFRFTLPLAVLLMLPVAAGADPAKDFLQTPVWYLSYEVSFSTSSKGTYDVAPGQPMTYTASVERVFTHSQILNLRSDGPGALGMMPTAMQQNGKMSVADAQKASMDLMARMEHTANWMVAGSGLNETVSGADLQADIAATVGELRLNYQRNEHGDRFLDEVGNKFSLTRNTRVTGTGRGAGGGFGSILLDVDTSTKTYLLSLGMGAGEQDFDREVVEVMTPAGGTPEEKKTNEKTNDAFLGLQFDEEAARSMQGGIVVSGTFDPASGKIVGENKYRGHYNDGSTNAPGTIVIKYTLSPTPAPKKAGSK